MEKTNWLEERIGFITSSNIYKIMNKGKGKDLTDTAESYLNVVAWEVMSGMSSSESNPIDTRATQWGLLHEGDAIKLYCKEKPHEYFGGENPKFFKNPKFEIFAGGSPDAIMGDEVIEVKCPYNGGNFIDLLRCKNNFKNEYPNYYWQLVHNAICTNKKIATLLIYDPRIVGRKNLIEFSFEVSEEEKNKVNERIQVAIDYIHKIISL